MAEMLGIDWSAIDIDAWLVSAREFALPRTLQSIGQLLLVAALYWVVRVVMRRIEKAITSRTKTELDDVVLSAIRRVMLLSVVFWGVTRIAEIWELGRLAQFIVAAWIVAFSIPLSRLATDLLKQLEQGFISKTQTRVDDTALPWINRSVQVLIIGSAVMIALREMGIDITPLLAGASVAGLAVSFAAKDTLANLIAGILLVIDRPFVVGDRIELWQTPVSQASWGDVVDIGIRATKIRTPDNIVVIIPNSVIMQRDIINWTASGDSIRLRIPIGIAYDADAGRAKEICLEAAAASDGVLTNPEPVCIIRSFGDSSVNLELRVWLRDARQRRAVGDWLTDHIKSVFDREGIEIPYPKRDLYIKNAPEAPAADGRPDSTALPDTPTPPPADKDER